MAKLGVFETARRGKGKGDRHPAADAGHGAATRAEAEKDRNVIIWAASYVWTAAGGTIAARGK